VKKEIMIFPRYHQLTVVRSLLADTLVGEIGNATLSSTVREAASQIQ
jgi:hypothetical protein